MWKVSLTSNSVLLTTKKFSTREGATFYANMLRRVTFAKRIVIDEKNQTMEVK